MRSVTFSLAGVVGSIPSPPWNGIALGPLQLRAYGLLIAIGAMVDASIVMVENANRKLSELGPKPDPAARRAALVTAAQEVGPGLFFSLLIITVSFLPVFALTGQSYRLFSPLAFTSSKGR